MFSHLAVATDFSEPVEQLLDHLDDFRRLGGQKVTLVHVRDVGYPVTPSATYSEFCDEQFARVVPGLEQRGWTVETRLSKGRPANEIVEVARDLDADLIAVANKGRSPLGEVLLGGVATGVLERTDRPVFVYCADATARADGPLGPSIVHPTDFSEPADRALSTAGRIASAQQLPVVLFHVMPEAQSGDSDELERRESALEQRKRQLEDQGVTDISTDLQIGAPRQAVVERLMNNPGALCVIGTQGRGRIRDFFLGGVTRTVARHETHHMLVVPGPEK